MKSLPRILIFVLCMISSVAVMAQNPIATLEHSGATQVFYGLNSFIDSYNASANGDQIYLSTGFFNPPPSITKGIKITGAGHFPDSANVVKRTFILGSVAILKGADSLSLEGLYIRDHIYYDPSYSINNVKVKRCRLNVATFQSNSMAASKNFCSYEECFIQTLDFSNYGSNFEIIHCIIGDDVTNCNNALFDGNIFLNSGGGPIFSNVNSSDIKNNIAISTQPFDRSTANLISNNLFTSSFDFGYNSPINNYSGVSQSNIFVNQTGNIIDYSQDYHLKSPTTYLGTDGTQIGIYGGTIPFKEKGMPSNPQITKKSVATQSDATGKLQINFTVKAQAN